MAKQIVEYDVVIVGGGPVGLTLAASLASASGGLKVAICDRRAFTVPNDGRSSALAAGVTRVFESLGIWDDMLPESSPITTMKVTDSGEGDLSRPLFLSFSGDVVPGRPYAHMVPNRVVIGGLMKAVADKVDLLGEVSVTGFYADKQKARLTLADGRELVAPLVVAADGKMSAIREMAGISTISHDYQQTGLVTTIAHEFEHDETAYEHFRPQGPLASLPLPGKRSSLVWTEKSAEAQRLKALSKEEQELAIESAMGSSLGKVEVLEPVQAYPLKLQIARSFTSERLALIGDAAHVVHPIAGQGLNLGLQDVAALAEVVIEAHRLGQDIGGADVLERYQRWRRMDTALMAVVTDVLTRLFSNDIAPVRAVRDFGLGVVDRLPLVKNGLIRQAAAVKKNGPKLMRGLPL